MNRTVCHLYGRRGAFYGKLRLLSWDDVQRRSMDTRDRAVAWHRLLQWRKEAEYEACGFLPPRQARDAARRPFADFAGLFLGDLKARGKSGATIHKYSVALGKLARECGWKVLSDVTAESYECWRCRCGLRAKTSNDYLNAALRLLRWLKKREHVLRVDLEKVELADMRREEREYRRALTPDEVLRLLQVTPWPRCVVYRMIVETGLRPRELRGLRWADLVPPVPESSGSSGHWTLGNAGLFRVAGFARLPPASDGQRLRNQPAQPHFPASGSCKVRVRASISKNPRTKLLDIGPGLAAEFLSLRRSNDGPAALVFRRLVPKPARWKADFQAAGIPLRDELGRRVDLHALRKTFGTGLVVNGAAPRVVMELMRHCDLKLTMKTYTDAGQLPTEQALELLPWRSLPARVGRS